MTMARQETKFQSYIVGIVAHFCVVTSTPVPKDQPRTLNHYYLFCHISRQLKLGMLILEVFPLFGLHVE